MRGWFVVGMLAVLAGVSVASAQPTAATGVARLPALATPVRLTPDLAAALAVQRSTEAAIDAQQINAAQGLLKEARAMRHLTVDSEASYSWSGPVKTFAIPPALGGGTIQFIPPAIHRETLRVTQPLYTGGRFMYANRAARANIAAAQGDAQATLVELVLAARQAVYGVLRLQQLVVVVEQRLTAVAEHLRIARAMFEAGTVARFEVVQAETELSRARGDVIHARTAVAQQKAVLAEILNVPQGTEMVVEEGVPPRLPDGDLHGLIGMALAERPEVGALEAVVRGREAQVRLAQAGDDFSLALQGQVNNQTASATSNSLNWNVAVTLTKPLYQGGVKEARVMQARAVWETARLNLERAQQGIALQVTRAQLGVDDAREALAVAEQGEVEARERSRIAQVRFSNGVSLGVEVLDAQSALAAAQAQVVNARYDLQVATAALRAALGLADLQKEPS